MLVYFLLGYLLYAAAFAVAGAMVSRQEDVQSAAAPLSIVLVAAYLVGISVIESPEGTLAVVTFADSARPPRWSSPAGRPRTRCRSASSSLSLVLIAARGRIHPLARRTGLRPRGPADGQAAPARRDLAPRASARIVCVAIEASDQQERARATWAAGEYDQIAEYIWSVGADLVGRVGIGGDDVVLDVGCGTGNATIPAAQTGARVTGLDLTPRLLEEGRRRAADAGVEIDFVEGDAEQLPFDDASFDVVLSTFGCMFAPRHEVAAAEIARVLQSGRADRHRRLDSGGHDRRLLPQPLRPWARHRHPTSSRRSSGARASMSRVSSPGTGVELRFEDTAVEFEFGSLDEAVDEYYEKFLGPIVMLRAALEPEGRGEEIRAALRGVFERANTAGGGAVAYPGEYLVTLGEKSGLGQRELLRPGRRRRARAGPGLPRAAAGDPAHALGEIVGLEVAEREPQRDVAGRSIDIAAPGTQATPRRAASSTSSRSSIGIASVSQTWPPPSGCM